jgi:hypothetical protein
MTDLVYVLGAGSQWDDNELRYSLRSLHAYVTGLGKLYVVGKCPGWLTNAVHLPYPDKYACKERNIMEKVAYACGHPDLSQTFLHVHDDHMALAPAKALEIPNWRGRTLGQLAMAINSRNHWRDAVMNTQAALDAAGHTAWNFDLHYPILMDKTLYPEVMDRYNWSGTPRGFVVKSLYANTLGLPEIWTNDLKLTGHFNLRQLVDKIKGRPWFSLGSHRPNQAMQSLLAALYPDPSPWEIV